MKKSVLSKTDEELLKDYPLKSRTEGWFVRIEEVSNGCWKAEAKDRFGRVANKTSTDDDPELLLKEIEDIIVDLNKR